LSTEATPIPRPLPRPSPFSRPFWEAARRHELLIQRCPTCRNYIFYPRLNCPDCGSRDLNWMRVSGRGRVYSYTVARRATHPAFAGLVPYVIAIVELEEGPHLTTNIIDCDPDSVRIDMLVEVAFEDVDATTSLVMFRPATS